MEITRQQFEQAAQLVNLEPEEAIDTGYSGRAMFGATCPALYADSISQVYAFVAALALAVSQEQDTPQDPYELVELLGSTRTDQMGTGIVAYWPGLTLTDL